MYVLLPIATTTATTSTTTAPGCALCPFRSLFRGGTFKPHQSKTNRIDNEIPITILKLLGCSRKSTTRHARTTRDRRINGIPFSLINKSHCYRHTDTHSYRPPQGHPPSLPSRRSSFSSSRPQSKTTKYARNAIHFCGAVFPRPPTQVEERNCRLVFLHPALEHPHQHHSVSRRNFLQIITKDNDEGTAKFSFFLSLSVCVCVCDDSSDFEPLGTKPGSNVESFAFHPPPVGTDAQRQG